MPQPTTISILKTYTAEDIEPFGNPITVCFNIMEATIIDYSPDDEMEIIDYVLEDIELFREHLYKGTGKPGDGYAPFYSDIISNIAIETIKNGKDGEAIRAIIIDEYHNQRGSDEGD